MGSSEKGEGDDKENVYEDEDSSDGEAMDVTNKQDGDDDEISTEESNEETTTSSATTITDEQPAVPRINPEENVDKGTPMATNSTEDDGAPLDIGEHYLVRRTDSSWCKLDMFKLNVMRLLII